MFVNILWVTLRHVKTNGVEMRHTKAWQTKLLESCCEESEGAEVARSLLVRTVGSPSAAELGDAICSLVDVPLTLTSMDQTAARIHEFSEVISAALSIRRQVTAVDIMKLLASEVLIVFVVASAIRNGRLIEEVDRQRLTLAVARIHGALDLAGISPNVGSRHE